EIAAAERGTAATRVIRHREREPLVLRRRPQGGLAAPRVADHGNPGRVDVRVGLQVIQNPAGTPCPGTNRGPGVRPQRHAPGSPATGQTPRTPLARCASSLVSGSTSLVRKTAVA